MDKGERIVINSLLIWKKDWSAPWWSMLQRHYDIRDLAISKFYTSLIIFSLISSDWLFNSTLEHCPVLFSVPSLYDPQFFTLPHPSPLAAYLTVCVCHFTVSLLQQYQFSSQLEQLVVICGGMPRISHMLCLKPILMYTVLIIFVLILVHLHWGQ